jgi:hypothetical protein
MYQIDYNTELKQNVGRQLCSLERAVGHSILFIKQTPKGFISEPYISPFRKDTHAGCYFIICKDNIIRFYDFADRTTWGLTTLSFIQKLYNVDKSKAFDIIFSNNESVKSYEFKLNNIIDLEKTHISVVYKDHISAECAKYLRKLFINQIPSEVTELKYYVVSKGDSSKLTICDTLTLCYHFTDTDHVKIYKPFTSKTHKFLGTVTTTDIFGWDYVKYFNRQKHLIITKSFKDWMILRNLGFQAIAIQSEGCTIPRDKIKIIKEFKKAIFLLDNDAPGIEAAMSYKLKYDIDYIHYPINSNIKDTADACIILKDKKAVKKLILKLLNDKSKTKRK